MWNMTGFIIYSQLNVLLLEVERTMVFSCFIDEEMSQVSVSGLYRIAQLAILCAEDWDRSPRSRTLHFYSRYFGSSWHRRLKDLWSKAFCPKALWSYTALVSTRKPVAVTSSASPNNILPLVWHPPAWN